MHLAPLQPGLAGPLRPQPIANSGDAATMALLKYMLLLGARHGHSNLCSGTALRGSLDHIGTEHLASSALSLPTHLTPPANAIGACACISGVGHVPLTWASRYGSEALASKHMTRTRRKCRWNSSDGVTAATKSPSNFAAVSSFQLSCNCEC
jgi:hypothetical protein